MPQTHGASPMVEVEEFGKDNGLVHEAVVTGRKVGAGRPFWSALAGSELLFRKVFDLVEAETGGPSSARMVSLKIARKILGSNRVYAGARVAKKWNVELGDDLPIRFTEADLQNAALDNASGKADFRLVRVLGRWSMRELHARFGIDPKKQPCFFKDSKWWLGSSEDKWANRKPTPGYYLFDFAGKWGSTSWDVQDVHIQASGSDFERADEVALVEAVLTIFQLTQERLLENWYHWGPTLASDGLRVCVGDFDDDGLHVDWHHPGYDDSGFLRVVRSRKFRS
ncbi:MAG: hypothetical protein Q7S16_01055 [bacterium]|nr:hypothetical protein [bacterium]